MQSPKKDTWNSKNTIRSSLVLVDLEIESRSTTCTNSLDYSTTIEMVAVKSGWFFKILMIIRLIRMFYCLYLCSL